MHCVSQAWPLSRCQAWMGTFFLAAFQNLIRNTYQRHRCLVGSLISLPCLIILGLDSRVGNSLILQGMFQLFLPSVCQQDLITALSRQPCVTRWRKRDICDFGEAGGKLAIEKRSSTHRDRPTLKSRFPNSGLDCWYLRPQRVFFSLSVLQ